MSTRSATKSVEDQALEQARQENTPDAKEYEQLDTNYRAKAYESVIKRSRVFIKVYPRSKYVDQVHNLTALSFIALKQYSSAISQLKQVLEITDNSALKNAAQYNLALVYFELGQIDAASNQIEKLSPSALTTSDRVKLHVLKAKIARLRQNHVVAAQEILGAIRFATEVRPNNPSIPSMTTFLDESLDSIHDPKLFSDLLTDALGTPVADRVLYRVAAAEQQLGNKSASKGHYKTIVAEFPNSKYYASALDEIRKLEYQDTVNPRRIGVLLTLTGKFGKFGYKALQGIELALKIFQKPTDPNPITLVVMDDQGEPERAVRALEDLYYKYQVAVVIGPLSSKLAETVGKKAQQLELPLISLTQREAIGGDFVFNAALTQEMQVRELVRYAVEKAGVQSFAVLAPTGKFGEGYGNAFWDEVERNGRAIRGFETYLSDETDFRTHIDRLVGLDQPEARARELEELRLLKAATPIKSHSKKFDRMFELKPIVDFQAVFIPDDPKMLGQILPTFAYRDVENVLFLGINTWNNSELISRAGQFAEGSVFVDGFYSGSQQPGAQKYIEEYQQTFDQEPSLVDALAHDAAKIAAHVLHASDVKSRNEVRDRIVSLKDFPGVTGKISYQAGRLTKRLSLLTVKAGKIEEIAFQ